MEPVHRELILKSPVFVSWKKSMVTVHRQLLSVAPQLFAIPGQSSWLDSDYEYAERLPVRIHIPWYPRAELIRDARNPYFVPFTAEDFPRIDGRLRTPYDHALLEMQRGTSFTIGMVHQHDQHQDEEDSDSQASDFTSDLGDRDWIYEQGYGEEIQEMYCRLGQEHGELDRRREAEEEDN